MKNLAVLDDYQNVALGLADWSRLDGLAEITVFNDHLVDEQAVAERLKDFEIICMMRERTPFQRSLLDSLPKLEHLFTNGMYNPSIDMAGASANGVVVTGSPTLVYPTAELTWGLILDLARSITVEDCATRDGAWEITLGQGLSGKTIGIIGLGRQGKLVARYAQAFDMKVLAWSENLTKDTCDEAGVELVSKHDLLAQSDFVTIHTRLSDRTLGLLGSKELGLMKKTAYLINTSRGPIVDEGSLVEALRSQQIAGAGLDVFDVEPLPLDHPLRTMPNTVITPHLGYVTKENYEITFETAVDNIASWLEGAILNEIKAPK